MWSIVIYLYLHIVSGLSVDTLLKTDLSKRNTLERFSTIADCIVTISDTELYYRPTVALLKQNGDSDIFSNAMIDALRKYHIPQIIAEDLNKIDKKTHVADANWLVVKSFDKCEDLTAFDFKVIKKQRKYLFVVPDRKNNDCGNIFKEIGYDVGNYDVTFIEENALAHNKMFTFIPKIDKDTCKEIIDKPSDINACVSDSVKNKEIFPIKNPVNLNKCPFKVGMATLYPFSVIKDAELLQTFDRISECKGSDMEIMKIVADYFNATVDLYYIRRSEENPFVDHDFLKFVLNGSLDACAGGLYRIYGDMFAYSGVYARQAVVWMYTAERLDQSLQNLLPKITGLYIFILFYFSYSFKWYLIRTFDKNSVSLSNTLLHSWGGLVGASSLQTALSLKQKILSLSYSVLCIYLYEYISIQLYSFLTIRGPPPIFKTNDDVMESGRKPFLKASTKYFVNDERYLRFANTSEDCFSFYDCAEKSLVHNGVTVILQGNFYDIQAYTAVNDEARILSVAENILTVYNEMLIRRNSSLVQKFQKVIQRLFEAGITQRLYYEAIGVSVIAKADRAGSNMVANSYSCQTGCAITFLHIAGVFNVWLLGCGLACCVFLIELFGKKVRK